MSYDPAIAKTEMNSTGNPIAQGYASAGGQAIYGQQPTYASPIPVQVHQPTGQWQAPPVSGTFNGMPYNGQAIQAAPTASRRPQQGRWADSICDWPSNLFPSCYCVCCVCYGMWISAQMAQKTQYGSFKNIMIAYICVFGVCCILNLVFPASGFVLWGPMLFAFVFALLLRMHIVQRDRIQECGSNPCFGEFCCGFFCWYCSVAQMARHVYGYKQMLDGDGDIDRPDGYGGAGLTEQIAVGSHNV